MLGECEHQRDDLTSCLWNHLGCVPSCGVSSLFRIFSQVPSDSPSRYAARENESQREEPGLRGRVDPFQGVYYEPRM